MKCHPQDPKVPSHPWLWPKQGYLRLNTSARRTLVTETPGCLGWQECCPSFPPFPLFAWCKSNTNSELISWCSLKPRSSVIFLSPSKVLIWIYSLPFPLIRIFFCLGVVLWWDAEHTRWFCTERRTLHSHLYCKSPSMGCINILHIPHQPIISWHCSSAKPCSGRFCIGFFLKNVADSE